ncbi:MAG: hypothetical protein R3E66_03045 [bacterium]
MFWWLLRDGLRCSIQMFIRFGLLRWAHGLRLDSNPAATVWSVVHPNLLPRAHVTRPAQPGSECDPTNQQCFAGRCVSNDDPQCDGVYCPQGEACFNGACVIACDADDACDPSSYCYQSACVEESCMV